MEKIPAHFTLVLLITAGLLTAGCATRTATSGLHVHYANAAVIYTRDPDDIFSCKRSISIYELDGKPSTSWHPRGPWHRIAIWEGPHTVGLRDERYCFPFMHSPRLVAEAEITFDTKARHQYEIRMERDCFLVEDKTGGQLLSTTCPDRKDRTPSRY